MGRGKSPPPTSMATVFVETTFNTRIGVLISPDDTIALLKRKIAAEHALCFPYIGEVNVQAVKVKRRALFYHLSDTMVVRNAFDGFRRTWFLYVDVEASHPDKQKSSTATIRADEKGKKFSLVDPSSPNIGKIEPPSLLTLHHGRLLSGEIVTKKSDNIISQENGAHNIFDLHSSELNMSHPPSNEMQTQTIKNNAAVEIQNKSHIDVEETTGVALVVAVKKEQSKKRKIVCQDVSTMESLTKQSFAQNKKHKAKDGSATFGSPAVETANHNTEETTDNGPHEDFMGPSQSKWSSQTNYDSSLPSSPENDTKKKKKKQQSYKLLGDIQSPGSGEVSFASAGNNDLMDKTKTTAFVGDRAIQRMPVESVQNSNVRVGELSHAGNDGDVGADNVVKHHDDACDRHDLVVDKTIIAEGMVNDGNVEKADINLLVGDASKKLRRKKKILGKSALENHLTEHDQIIADRATKENQQIGHVGDHADLSNVSDGAALQGETTTIQRLADADYGISVRLKDGQSRRKQEKATKNKVGAEEHSKESKSLENHDKNTDLQPPPVNDKVSPHNISDGNIGYLTKHLATDSENNEDEVAKKADIPGESVSLEKTLLVYSAVRTRPSEKKSRRGKTKSAKSELWSSHDLETESLNLSEENTRKLMGNDYFDQHEVSEQASMPFEVGVSTSNPADTLQVNQNSSKEAVMDSHKNSSKMSEEQVVTGEAQSPSKPIAKFGSSIQPNDKKSRRSKKKSAQPELLSDETKQSELDHSVEKEVLQNNKSSEEVKNEDFEKKSQFPNVRTLEPALQEPMKENSIKLLITTQTDSQIALENLENKTDNRQRKQSKKSKKSSLSEEALNYVNPPSVESDVPPDSDVKKPRHNRRKAAKIPTESLVPLEKEVSEENAECTHQKNERGIDTAIAAVVASIECPAGKNLSVDMNDNELPPGNENTIRNVHEADGPCPGSLLTETIEGVDNTVQEDIERVVQEALVDSLGGKEFASLDAKSMKLHSEKTKKKRRKSDRQEEDYHAEEMSPAEKHSNGIKYGLPDPLEHHNGKGDQFSCIETDDGKVNNYKAKRRKRKSDAHANNSSQAQNKLGEKPFDDDPAKLGLNNHLELHAGEEYRSHKYNQAAVGCTTNSKGQDGITNNSDLGSPKKSRRSCYSENMLEEDRAVRKKSESIDNQSEVMHKAETKALNAENDQSHHSSGRTVAPKKGFIDEHVASDESMEVETPIQNNRHRLAVRKVPRRKIARVLENSKQKKTMTASSGTIFDDSACGSSDEELMVNGRKTAAVSSSGNSFASADSDGESDETSFKSLKNLSSSKTPQGFWTNARGDEDKEILSGDDASTQLTIMKRSLGAILKGTSSYRKAKLSQSHDEDADSQPDDIVLETQTNYSSS